MKHKSRNLIRSFLTLLVFSSAVFAITLPRYREKIHEAKQSVDILFYSDEEETNQAENIKLESNALKKIRANFPAVEKVEWQGASVDVENVWLLERLRDFENEPDSGKRSAILSEVSERLGAIETKLDEVEKAAATIRTKDEDKQKLAEILRRSEYQKPEEKKENFLQRMWREFKEWLASVFPKPKMGAPSIDGMKSLSFVLQIVIFGLLFGIIGFLIYRFAPFLRDRFKGRIKKDRGVRVILGERLAADATSGNLFAEAERLAREGNLRDAIRKGYIALLCELNDRKVIGLAQHKTNRDYLRDLRNMTELHANMSGLTGSFERHWYGFSATEEKDWEDFKSGYRKAVGKSH